MKNYSVNKSNKWDYENGFYLTCGKERVGKLLNHLKIYERILNLPGDIVEFGVYKGTSLMRFLYFRELLENESSRKIFGFDVFGEFPRDQQYDMDKNFVENFESKGGLGISETELDDHIKSKGINNYELIKGDINKTLPDFLIKNPHKRFAMIHIDVDVYEPTKNILKLIYSKLVPNGILILDDYGTVYGETLAVDEFFESNSQIFNKERFYHIPTFIVKK